MRSAIGTGCWLRRSAAGAALGLAAGLVGCVTPAEFEKLRVRVIRMERGESGGPSLSSGPGGEHVADLRTEVDRLSREVEKLAGRLEVAEHQTEEALREAKAARGQSAGVAVPPAPTEGAGANASGNPPAAEQGVGSAELALYRSGYSAWSRGDSSACIDQFRSFLQNHASSPYADDAAYWMADCYFKNGDLKSAVLRFDDVVSRYPTGNKAPDALYRQGEALLKLGPAFGKAARTAFERVVKEYPNSPRVAEAKKQLELLAAG
jgi:tol-pal system protein YbgF